MAFDECAPADSEYAYTKTAMDRTHNWLGRCKEYHKGHEETQALFGIVQGGMFKIFAKKVQNILLRWIFWQCNRWTISWRT